MRSYDRSTQVSQPNTRAVRIEQHRMRLSYFQDLAPLMLTKLSNHIRKRIEHRRRVRHYWAPPGGMQSQFCAKAQHHLGVCEDMLRIVIPYKYDPHFLERVAIPLTCSPTHASYKAQAWKNSLLKPLSRWSWSSATLSPRAKLAR